MTTNQLPRLKHFSNSFLICAILLAVCALGCGQAVKAVPKISKFLSKGSKAKSAVGWGDDIANSSKTKSALGWGDDVGRQVSKVKPVILHGSRIYLHLRNRYNSSADHHRTEKRLFASKGHLLHPDDRQIMTSRLAEHASIFTALGNRFSSQSDLPEGADSEILPFLDSYDTETTQIQQFLASLN